MAKRAKDTPPDTGIVKVVDPLYDAPVAVDVPHDMPPPSGPTFGQRARRFLDVVVRLVSWVIIFTVFGAALYFGVPMLYQRFVAPVEQNTAQMADLQSQQEQAQQELASLQEQVTTLQDEQSQNMESLTDLNTRLAALDERLDEVQTEIAVHSKSLVGLEKIQSDLQAQDEAAAAELARQIDLMKSVELLSRARLYMYQSNFGLAQLDVQAAHDLLEAMNLDESDVLADDHASVIRRLDLVLANLPSFPVAAADDLDIAWQILVSGLPAVQTPESEATAITPTPQASPAATFTPTPQATLQPTIEP